MSSGEANNLSIGILSIGTIWWLRDFDYNGPVIVGADGIIDRTGCDKSDLRAVRAALYLDITKIYYDSSDATIKPKVAVTSVTLAPTTAQTVSYGGTSIALTATVNPDTATDSTVKWSVNNSNVSLYSDAACNTLVGIAATTVKTVYAKGTAAGTAKVTVTSNDDSTKIASVDFTVNKVAAPALAANQKPTAKTGLVSDGSAKALINAPAAALPAGYSMKYAVTDTNAAPSDESYAASIPTKTNAGTYYVWYKALGDGNHADTTPASITVTISEQNPNSGGSETGAVSETTDNAQQEITETVDNKQKNTKLSKPKASKKSFSLTWKKATAKGIKGYEIQYSTDKSFSKDTTSTKAVNKVKTTSLKIKGLKPKTKYYVRIRTFSKKNGEKVYSKWSTVKAVKVK